MRAHIARRYGAALDDAAVSALLLRRAAALSMKPDPYVTRFASDNDFDAAAVIAEITVGETYFFRHASQLRACADIAFARPALRILSAGCATGEELYSLAILAREAGVRAELLGVDVNPHSIALARRGRYGPWSLRDTPAPVQRRWFCDGELDASIRAMVRFECKNLVDDDDALWSPARFDVIFCRNVIMYFDADTQAAVIERCARALAIDGALFLGHAETVRTRNPALEVRARGDAFYYARVPRTAADDEIAAPIAAARALVAMSID
ncbi:MAG TPA: CheR family methyltransferase, partial [Myxococcota bacterium]